MADVQHNAITDPYIHEPKGVSTATAGYAYLADGAGSGDWSYVLTEPNFSFETVLKGTSVATSQNPTGTGSAGAITVEFGPGQHGPSDPVMLSSGGIVTCNEAGLYFLRVALHVGRTGGAGVAKIHIRALKNGVQYNPTYSVFVESADSLHTVYITHWIKAAANDTYKIEIARDATGNNSGGLLGGGVTVSGWDVSPTAFISVGRLING